MENMQSAFLSRFSPLSRELASSSALCMPLCMTLCASLILFSPAYGNAQVSLSSPTQLSLGKNGEVPNGTSGSPILSGNSSLVVFRSSADNLVEGDQNQDSDVFVRDLSSGAVTRASVNSSGQEANSLSNQPSISTQGPDGFYAIGFTSTASNLGSVTDSENFSDVYLRLPTLQYTEVVSVNQEGQLGDANSSQPSVAIMSAPNRVLVAYASRATNLVSDDTNGFQDIFLATLTAPSTLPIPSLNTLLTQKLLTKAANGAASDGASDEPRISGNARYVAFSSSATNLLAGRTTTGKQIFLFNLQTGERTLVSKSSSGSPADQECSEPSISFNGRYVSYLTRATNIVSGNSAARVVLVVYDSVSGSSQQVNVSSTGTPGNGGANDPVLSANGRFISFSDSATNLLSSGADTNNLADVFVKDLQTGQIVRVSTATNGETDGASDTTYVGAPSFNALQALISYRSFATNLTEDSSAGGAGDVFLNSASISAPALQNGLRLEVPADIQIMSNRRSVITLQEFATTSVAGNSGRRTPELLAATETTKVRYEVRVEGLGNRKRDRIKQVGRRNQVTTRKLKPGKYTVTYKASVVKSSGGSTGTSSSFSPRQRFEVPG
jgi:hypothetical protein